MYMAMRMVICAIMLVIVLGPKQNEVYMYVTIHVLQLTAS